MYVAGRPIKVHRGDEVVSLNPGDPVPEAPTWGTFKACLRVGEIVWQPDNESAKAEKESHAAAKAERELEHMKVSTVEQINLDEQITAPIEDDTLTSGIKKLAAKMKPAKKAKKN